MNFFDDKRENQRFNLALPLQVKVSNQAAPKDEIKFKTSDISSTGAFVSTDLELSVGTSLEINIDIPLEALENLKGNTANVALTGKVIRISGRGMALSFDKDCEFRYLSATKNIQTIFPILPSGKSRLLN